MSAGIGKHMMVAALGFMAGIGVTNLPQVLARDIKSDEIAEKTFMVSIDEIRARYVFADRFKGSYVQEVRMSDGSTRTIKLTPMIRKGMRVVELNDNGGITYMGLNGTTINGKLMIQLRDVEELTRQLKEQGWKPN